MASLPRIITVDPTGSIPQQIRAAFDLMDRLVIQIDVPGPNEALDELKRGGIDAVFAAWKLGNGMQAWELASKLKQVDSKVAIILMGDYEDTELDEEMLAQSPFVYLKRPFDIPQLINVVKAALDGSDIFEAVKAPVANIINAPISADLGIVPSVNADKADDVLQGVMSDLNPIAAMVATRDGQIVAGRTTLGDIDYDYMAKLLGSTAGVTIDMRDVIGGNTQAFNFYDGDDYDVFLLSVGLHHFLAVVFDGKEGQRQLGSVIRFGRRRAEDLIAVIGPSAFFIQRAVPQEEEHAEIRRKSEQAKKVATQEISIPELVRADLGSSHSQEEEIAPVVQPQVPQLEAISDSDFDINDLFGGDFDEAAADDLFSLDAMEELAADEGKKGTLDFGKAQELGILGDM